MYQAFLIRGDRRFTVAQVRIVKPFLGAIIQFLQPYTGTVEVKAIHNDSHILFTAGQQQFFRLLQIGYTGPCHEFYADGLLVLSCQVAQFGKLFCVKRLIRCPDIAEDVMDSQLGRSGKSGLIAGHIYFRCNAGVFCVVQFHSGLLAGSAGFTQ